jgi:TonB family protein
VTLDLLLKSCFVLVVAMAVVKLMTRSSAASRHLVWTGAFVALLALPIARGVVPELPLRVLPADALVPSPIATASASVVPAPVRGVTLPSDAILVTTAPVTLTSTTAAATSGSRNTVARAFQMVWVAGIVILLLRAGVGVWLLRRMVQRARVVDDTWILSRVESARTVLHLRRPVRLLIADTDVMPATWGVFRPTLVLPSSVRSWRGKHAPRLDAVLMHELAHVARRDALAQLVARVASAAFWCNPLAWIAARQTRLERERACDDAVLASGTSASSYAGELMALLHSTARAAAPLLAMARAPQIEQRIGSILDVDTNRRGVSRASRAGVVALLLFATSAASVRVVARATTAPTQISAIREEPVLGVERPSRRARLALRSQAPPPQAIPSTPAAQTVAVFHDTVTVTDYYVRPLPGPLPGPGSSPSVPTAPIRPFGAGARWPAPGISPPRPIYRPQPDYTAEGMSARIEGVIEVEAIVLPSGDVGDVRISRSLDGGQYGLDQAALKTAKQWQFEPGYGSDGNPLAVYASIRFTMTLFNRGTWTPLLVVSAPSGTLKAPVRIARLAPNYPDWPKRAGSDAIVIVETTTDVTGKVVSARMVESNPFFDDMALGAAKSWTFTPTLVNGVAVPTTVTTTIRFMLNRSFL